MISEYLLDTVRIQRSVNNAQDSWLSAWLDINCFAHIWSWARKKSPVDGLMKEELIKPNAGGQDIVHVARWPWMCKFETYIAGR